MMSPERPRPGHAERRHLPCRGAGQHRRRRSWWAMSSDVGKRKECQLDALVVGRGRVGGPSRGRTRQRKGPLAVRGRGRRISSLTFPTAYVRCNKYND